MATTQYLLVHMVLFCKQSCHIVALQPIRISSVYTSDVSIINMINFAGILPTDIHSHLTSCVVFLPAAATTNYNSFSQYVHINQDVFVTIIHKKANKASKLYFPQPREKNIFIKSLKVYKKTYSCTHFTKN